MGQRPRSNHYRRACAVLTLAVCATFCGCQSLTATLDRLVPPWGPPEQWEPSYSNSGDKAQSATDEPRPNYAAIFEEDSP